jgi:HK97 family phage major capsid protein
MSYSNVISRSNAEALIPEDVAKEIIKAAPEQSAVMQLGRRLPNMSRQQRRMPVLNSLITGGFVDGDTGLKQTSAADWQNKYLTAAEIAVIVPIPEAVLDDADYNIWEEIKPQIAEEFGRIFDAAVLFGTDKPADWPDGLVQQATAKGHVVDLSTVEGGGGDLYDALLGANGSLAKVEEDGFMVTGHVAAMSMKGKLRSLRDTSKQPIFMRGMQSSSRYELDGEPIYFPKNGAIRSSDALVISGDWNQLVWSIRQDLTYKVLDQAVITDASGGIVYNLAQQDMVALRAVMRVAWQLPNPATALNENESTRFPFAVLVE